MKPKFTIFLLVALFFNIIGFAGSGHLIRDITENSISSKFFTLIKLEDCVRVYHPQDITVCSGKEINVDEFVSSPIGAAFAWTNSNTAIGLAASGTGQIATYSAPTNNTGSDLAGTVTVTPYLNGCYGLPQSFTITIIAPPTLSLTSAICSANLQTYNIVFVSNGTVTSTGGTVDNTAKTVTGITSGSSVILTSTLNGCVKTLGVTAPDCSRPAFTLGWSGTDLVPTTNFCNSSGWITNVPNAGLGDKSNVTASGDTLTLNWTFGTGNRYKWAQCYLPIPQSISLKDYDLFGFNLKGMKINGFVGFELKFEDGTHQASVRWDGLAGLNRWAEKISVTKKQFENSASLDWSKVKVISLAVYSQASDQYVSSEKGSISICHLVGDKMINWERATSREFIHTKDFTVIKENAINAIIKRQKTTGLLATWINNGSSSWLYGQGLALKALCIEGKWVQGVPDNAAAIAAQKLALFLSTHQQPEGYWPRAWNSESGAIQVLREADGTVFMGDFPWIITGLQAYYKKSGDLMVKPAVEKGLAFLRSLIMPDGKFLTINPQTGIKSEVSSCEAYASAIVSLYESGDESRAKNLFNYVSTYGWDSQLRSWREAIYSDRVALFANTWLSYYQFQKGEIKMGLDALSLTGKVLYTHGNGTSFGMDGFVPLSVWFEGTLSYIAAGGPESIALFEEIRKQIHSDGMVSHYNENLEGIGGIWAVDWHSLDGTSWLYFTTAGISPFEVIKGFPVGVESIPYKKHHDSFEVSLLQTGELFIRPLVPFHKEIQIRVIKPDGRIISERKVPANSGEITLSISPNHPVHEIIFIQILSNDQMECHTVLK